MNNSLLDIIEDKAHDRAVNLVAIQRLADRYYICGEIDEDDYSEIHGYLNNGLSHLATDALIMARARVHIEGMQDQKSAVAAA